jgi:hypothetical protein
MTRHYAVRDQMGHFVAPRSEYKHPCPHLCCMGKRVHPDKLPVKLDRKYLRSLSGPELETELSQYANYADTHEHGFTQIIAEVDRRETIERNAHARKARAKDRRAARNQEYSDEVYRQWLLAENQTNGNMLNKAGRAKGIDERSLFTGPEARVRAYASRELQDFFLMHPRPTRAAFYGNASQRRAAYAGRGFGGSA